MNENAEKWVAALRSGEYKQGRKTLQSKEGFCCLGVACDLAVKAGLPIIVGTRNINTDFGTGIKEVITYDGKPDYLPPIVQKWLGLSTASGGYKDGNLAIQNDFGSSFAEIADIIENHPEMFLLETV